MSASYRFWLMGCVIGLTGVGACCLQPASGNDSTTGSGVASSSGASASAGSTSSTSIAGTSAAASSTAAGSTTGIPNGTSSGGSSNGGSSTGSSTGTSTGIAWTGCFAGQTATGGTTGGNTQDAGQCFIDGGFYPNHSLNPGSADAQCCNPFTSPGTWLPLFTQLQSFPVNDAQNGAINGVNDGFISGPDATGQTYIALTAYDRFTSMTSEAWVYLASDAGIQGPLQYVESRPGETWPGGIVVADMNHDGLNDFVISSASTLDVYLNDGMGGFAFSSSQSTSCATDKVRVADINGDGWPDFVLGDCGVSVFFNDASGDGALLPAYAVGAQGGAQTTLAVGDFDGNGTLDIAYPSQDGIVWAMNNCAPPFEGPFLTSADPSNVIWLSALPVAGGDALIVTHSDNRIEVLLPTSQGPGMSTTYPLVSGGGPTDKADVNHDGLPDLIVAGGGAIDVLVNQGNGTFAPAVTVSAPGADFIQRLKTGDLNGDGTTDVGLFWGNGPFQAYVNSCP